MGYSSFALYEGGEVSLDEAGTTLLSHRARRDRKRAARRQGAATHAGSWLAQAGATFVTLTKDGALRGCIGSLEPARPLGEDVAQNALAAAFRDPRFPALERRGMAAMPRRGVAALRRPSRCASPTRPTCWRRSAPARTA